MDLKEYGMAFAYKLPKDYIIKELPSEEFDPQFRKYAKRIFEDESLMYNRQTFTKPMLS